MIAFLRPAYPVEVITFWPLCEGGLVDATFWMFYGYVYFVLRHLNLLKQVAHMFAPFSMIRIWCFPRLEQPVYSVCRSRFRAKQSRVIVSKPVKCPECWRSQSRSRWQRMVGCRMTHINENLRQMYITPKDSKRYGMLRLLGGIEEAINKSDEPLRMPAVPALYSQYHSLYLNLQELRQQVL